MKELFVFLMLILSGLLPGIGFVRIFASGAYMVGKSITNPYDVLIEHKARVAEVHKSLRGSAFLMGVSQMLLALIPLLGGLLMSLLSIFQCIGLTYALEEANAYSSKA